jgi:hypothetical protein
VPGFELHAAWKVSFRPSHPVSRIILDAHSEKALLAKGLIGIGLAIDRAGSTS